MYKILIILTLICFTYDLGAQTKPETKLSIEEQSELMEKNSVCTYRNNFTQAQRRLFYPFNKTDKISLISFDNPYGELSSRIPVEKRKLNSKLVKERRDLSALEIDKLTDLIYNYGFKSKEYGWIEDHGACYDPHNGILFFNEKGLVIEYIEICFDCIGQRTSSDKIKLGENCLEKFSLLRGFFSSLDIKAGTTKKSAEE